MVIGIVSGEDSSDKVNHMIKLKEIVKHTALWILMRHLLIVHTGV